MFPYKKRHFKEYVVHGKSITTSIDNHRRLRNAPLYNNASPHFHLHIHKREITYRSVIAILVKKVEKERSVVVPNNLNRCGRAS